MTQAPSFFVPAATPETQESVFADLARIAQRSVPPLAERIYSITYLHDGEEWTATVGESLRGISRKITRSKGKKKERLCPVADPAIVLAIFPGVAIFPAVPYIVVTNHGLPGNVGSAWENTFLAGQPKSVTRFYHNDQTG